MCNLLVEPYLFGTFIDYFIVHLQNTILNFICKSPILLAWLNVPGLYNDNGKCKFFQIHGSTH